MCKLSFKNKYLQCISAAALWCVSSAVSAQNVYPSKPIRLIVAFPAGGSTDIIARLVGQRLGEKLGQQVVIDNRGGAGGTIGTEIAARANPDGYTLTMGTTSTHVIAVGAYKSLRYDPVKDFEPITLVASTPYLLVVNPAVKANTLKEFIALAKSQPGKMNYASAGTGTTTQLAMEMLKMAAAIDVVHIPFGGNGPAGVATIGGQVQALFGSMPAVLPQAKAGRLRPLAVGTPKRSTALPDVPSVAEFYPGFDASLWLGFFAPKGTPAPILKRLNTELTAIAQSPEMKEQFERNGADPLWSNSPAELNKLVASEIDKYTKVIKAAGIAPQ
jgi:tripartite-type tricarboxylate transporter receptor subunit TctC